MTRPSTPPILSEIRSASSPTSQVAALRALKNEVIGHEQKKEMWIRLGVLAPIARILNTYKGSGKRKHRDAASGRGHHKQKGPRTEEEEARLQAIIIVGSIAQGGPAYVSPICASQVLPPLLSLLSPAESPPRQVLAVLKSLNAIADSLLLSHPDRGASGDGFLQSLYTESHLSTLTRILSQSSNSPVPRQQIALTAELIHKTCQEEQYRAMLAQAGILEALAARLSNLIAVSGCARTADLYYGIGSAPTAETFRAQWRSKMSCIFRATSAIIKHSKLRAVQFLSAPAFTSLFQRSDADTTSNERKAHLWGPNVFNAFTTRATPLSLIDNLLPALPSPHNLNAISSSNFPPLGSVGSSGKQGPQSSRSFSTAIEVVQSHGLEYIEEEESPFLNWLLYIVRTEDEVTGLSAAWVLAILYRHGLAKRGRESAFALLLVPTLSRLLDKDVKLSPNAFDACEHILTTPDKLIKEQAPLVLAMFAAKSLEVQKAAVDAGVVKKLSQLLKESYNEVPSASSNLMWSPEPPSLERPEFEDPISKLGPIGLSLVASHVMKVREGVLVAIAAIASDKDDYRKAIIDNGVIPFVIKTLNPKDIESSPASVDKPKDGVVESSTSPVGNPKDTILAACGAARALSRSVSTLRTSLMDSGLPAPIMVLLQHEDINLQIAATAVVCNLCFNFSPMQETMLNAGAMRILCQHAHSSNTNLRLNSIWAIKNFTLTASNENKMKCLEELGPGWLKQIISNNVESPSFTFTLRNDREDGSVTPIRMSTPNAAGEQVDLLNAIDEDSRESSPDRDDAGDLKMADSVGALSKTDLNSKTHLYSRHQSNGNTGSLSKITDWRSSSLSDELAIQVQGLDVLRNLICGEGAAAMIDFVFQELGQAPVFEMLASKLRPKVFNAFNRERRSSENGVRHVQPPTEIVIATCYVLVHLAAGNSRQRQLLVAQSELLKLIVPLFNHPDAHVRANCIWVCTNLTWVDDASDSPNCKSRARELANLGLYEKLEQMEHDPELDVRERAKTATHQMSSLLRL